MGVCYIFPMSYFREPFNGLSHLAAAVISIFGTALLVAATWEEPGKRISLAVYGATLTLMLSASAAYHSIRCDKPRLKRLRKIDHATIYALIAGTYTPLCYVLFRGFWHWGLLTLVWALAITGMILKIFHISKSDWAFIGLYLALGWLCVIGSGEMLRVLPGGALAWLLGGGMLYTVGAVLVAARKPDFLPGVFGHHEVWHIFVTAAAFCHYMLMVRYVVPAGPSV